MVVEMTSNVKNGCLETQKRMVFRFQRDSSDIYSYNWVHDFDKAKEIKILVVIDNPSLHVLFDI